MALVASCSVSAGTLLGTVTITGSAMIDTQDILNSNFGDFDVSYATAQWYVMRSHPT